MRWSTLFGAGLLLLAAAFVAVRGPSRLDEITDDVIDQIATEPRPGAVLDPLPV
jgi:hypothetical protein